MDLSRWAEVLATHWGQERDAGCHEALNFGPRLGPQMLIAAIGHLGSDPTFTPATHVCDAMLLQGDLFDYRYAIQIRAFQPDGDLKADLLDGVAEETQGYVDATSLYCGVSAWAQQRAMMSQFGDIPGDASEPSVWLANWPAFRELSRQAAEAATRFVLSSETWAKANFELHDLIDAREFMTKLVLRAEVSPGGAPYRRGVRTSRDTLIAYSAVLISVLAPATGVSRNQRNLPS
jgi:hypothetical protein